MNSSQLFADLSSNNGPVNIANYARAGHVAIAIKATQGNGYTNPYHEQQCNIAHDFGLTVIHYLYCDRFDSQEEINHFRHIYNKAWRNGDYACFDIEEPYHNVNKADDILKKYYEQTQREPLLYTYRDMFQTKLHNVKIPGNRVWIADYSTNTVNLPSWYTLWARQYTDGKEGPEPHYYSGIGQCDGSYLTAGVAKALYLRKLRTRKRK